MSKRASFVSFATSLLVCLGAHAKIVTQDVSYPYQGKTMKGYLAYDDAVSGPRAGVLVVHEWWGLDDYIRGRARQVAEMGYVAFAPDMYGEGKVTADPKEAGATRSWDEMKRFFEAQLK